jgi:hypothetical protein
MRNDLWNLFVSHHLHYLLYDLRHHYNFFSFDNLLDNFFYNDLDRLGNLFLCLHVANNFFDDLDSLNLFLYNYFLYLYHYRLLHLHDSLHDYLFWLQFSLLTDLNGYSLV